jgi:hypothetical protein
VAACASRAHRPHRRRGAAAATREAFLAAVETARRRTVAIGRWGVHLRWVIVTNVVGCASLLTAVIVITSCSSGGGAPGSSSPVSSNAATTPSSSGASQSTAPEPKMFTSATYGYRVPLPAEWTTIQALDKWDGQSGLTFDYSAQVDQFGSASTAVFAVAAHWKRDLAAYTRFWIVWNARYHGEHCPPAPNTRNPITIGGQPGVLLAYNCGILINIAATVHSGVGYSFSFRDLGVQAATDPTDHATFLNILRSVQLPD